MSKGSKPKTQTQHCAILPFWVRRFFRRCFSASACSLVGFRWRMEASCFLVGGGWVDEMYFSAPECKHLVQHEFTVESKRWGLVQNLGNKAFFWWVWGRGKAPAL